jgi:predicted transcriptional regulator
MKPKSGKLGPRLTVSLTGQDYETLNALAEREHVSASWVVRRAIEEFLRKQQMELDLSLPSSELRQEH